MEAPDVVVSNPAKDRSMRASRSLFVLCGLALASPETCFAQVGQIGSYSRPRTNNYPTVSPYLNLARPGQAATNYYGIVRPQVEANQAFQQIQQGTFTTDPRFGPAMGPQGAGPDGGVIPGMNQLYPNQAAGLQTGHPAVFQYTSHYFPMPNMQRGAGGASSGMGVAGNAFGRPGPGIPFFAGSNGVLLPVNPGGANPLGGVGAPFGTISTTGPTFPTITTP
jgi:hypothetical protein